MNSRSDLPRARRASGLAQPSRRQPRRQFLRNLAAASTGCALPWNLLAAQGKAAAPEDERIREQIEAHRPSKLDKLPADFNARVGSAHVAGKYCLTQKPFLIEGAEKLLALGSRLGKFWFMPDNPAQSYPFHSQWGRYKNFVELAKSDYFQQLFALPFATVLLEAHTPTEAPWRKPDLPASFYQAVTQEFYDLTAHLYRTYRDRPITFVLQHWEGDWMLRGAGQLWKPPPADWRLRCEAMTRWLAARQAGVTKARDESSRGAKCMVAHAAEVNRVADLWQNVPTMTEHVLPNVELDLVSYSAYDAMGSAVVLWKCIAEIRRHARTGPLFGKDAVFLGELGIPENEQTQRIAGRVDEWLGVMLAAGVKWFAYWELYCNEPATTPAPPKAVLPDPKAMRGFWLVKPDGALSESGKFLAELWKRGR
jgi:hypothetical protein